MAQTKELGVKLNAQTSGFKSAMAKAAGSVGKVGAAVAAAGAVAAGALGAKAVGAAMSYEQAMADVKAASGATDEEMAKLDDKAKQLGKSTKFMITDIAGAEKALVKTGYSAKEATAAMDGVAAAAAASGESLPQVAEQLTNVVKGYGLTAKDTTRVADVFAEAARSSNTTINSLSQGMAEVGPVASEMGQSIEKTTAMLGLLGDAGIKGSKAGRVLRAGMIRFQKAASGDITKDARGSLKKLGINVSDLTSGKMSFTELISKMDKAGAGAGEFAQIFGMRATPSLMKLADNINSNNNELASFTEKLKDSKGAAQEMAETQLDTLSGQLTILHGSWNLLMTTIGQKFLPFLKNVIKNGVIPFTNSMMDIIEKSDSFNEFFYLVGEQYIPGFGKAIKRIQSEGFLSWIEDVTPSMQELGQAAENLGVPSIISDNLKEIGQAIGIIAGAFATYEIGGLLAGMASGLAGLASAAAGFLWPLLALTAAIAGGIKIWNSFFSGLNPVIADFASTLWNTGIKAIKDTWDALTSGNFKKIPKIWSKAFNKIKNKAIEVWPKIRKEIKEGMQEMWKATKDVTQKMWDQFKQKFPNIASKVEESFKRIKKGWNKAQKVFNKIKQGAQDIGAGFKEAFAEKLPGLKKAFAGIKKAAQKFWGNLKPVLNKIGQAFANLFKSEGGKGYGELLKTTAKKYLGGVLNVVEDLMGTIQGALTLASGVLSGDWEEAFKGLKKMGKSMLNAIKDAWGTAIEGIKNALKLAGLWDDITKIQESLKDWTKKAYDITLKWINKGWDTVKDAYNKVKEWIGETYDLTLKWINDKWDKVKSAVDTATEWTKDKFNLVVKWTNKGWDTVKSAIDTATGWTEDKFNLVVKWTNKGWSIIKDAYNKIKNWVSEALSFSINWPDAPGWLKWVMNHMGFLGIGGNNSNNDGRGRNNDNNVSTGLNGINTGPLQTSTNKVTNNLSQLADQLSSTAQDLMVLPPGQEFADFISGKYPELGKTIVADKSTTENQFDFSVKTTVKEDNTEWIMQQLRALQREIEQSQGGFS